jgi:hypothetical protein
MEGKSRTKTAHGAAPTVTTRHRLQIRSVTSPPGTEISGPCCAGTLRQRPLTNNTRHCRTARTPPEFAAVRLSNSGPATAMSAGLFSLAEASCPARTRHANARLSSAPKPAAPARRSSDRPTIRQFLLTASEIASSVLERQRARRATACCSAEIRHKRGRQQRGLGGAGSIL